jgi:hypothetical protein
MNSLMFRVMFLLAGFLLYSACADRRDYAVIHPPQYDYLIGQPFSQTVFGRPRSSTRFFRGLSTTEGVLEFEDRRSDGCVLVFGVRKSDDLIQYWRVDSGAGTCLVRNKAFTV